MQLKHDLVIVVGAICICTLLPQTRSLSYTPFQRFTFAPNNVCIKPLTFHATKVLLNATDDDVTAADAVQELEFTMRNVPGEGDCMFLAVALATSASMGLGANDALLRAVADETRGVVAQVLSAKEGNLHVEGKRIVRVADLLSSAARKEGVECGEYLELLRDGTLQGGGPELTVLSNVLRRPISVYELVWDDAKYQDEVPDACRVQCAGSFGDIFKDPLAELPNAAVISGLQQGAYSWHIHVLVVDSGGGEKHAVALLPKDCYL